MRGAGRPKSPITRSDLAARKGVHPSTVTKHCQPGGALHAAVLPGGDVDLAHPATKAWLRGDHRRPGRKPAVPRDGETVHPADGDEGADGDDDDDDDDDPAPAEDWDPLQSPEHLASLSYEEARRRYAITIEQWVRASKAVAETEKVRVHVAQRRGELIAVDLVENYVFGALDALSERLLRDTARTAAIDAYMQGQRSAPREEAVATMREHLESQLTPVKESVVRSIEAAIEKARGNV